MKTVLAIMWKNSRESERILEEALISLARSSGGLVRTDEFELVKVWNQQDLIICDGEERR